MPTDSIISGYLPPNIHFAPRQIRPAGDNFLVQYSPSGRIDYLGSEGGHTYLYRMKDDGTQEEKISFPNPSSMLLEFLPTSGSW